jgi:hypothetical protein
VAIALPVMIARPRPRFRRRAGGGGDAGAAGGADFGGADLGGGGGVSGGAGFGRRGSALVPWSCAFPRPACPFFGTAGSSRLAASRSGLALSSSG